MFRIAVSLDRKHVFVVYNPFTWLHELDAELQMPAVARQEFYKVVLGMVRLAVFGVSVLI